MKRNIIVASLLFIALTSFGQTFRIVPKVTINSTPTESYVVTESGVLKPGTRITPSVNYSFFLRAQDITVAVPTASKNYIKTELPRKSAKSDNEVAVLGSDDKPTVVTYINGLGKSVQSIDMWASPSRVDVINFNVFDAYGRQPKSYLPYTVSSGGAFRTTPVTEQLNFYTNQAKIPVDTEPFGLTVFDDSPMNNVTQTTKPGWRWHNDSEALDQITSLRLNNSSEVFMLTFDDVNFPVYNALSFYPANQLEIKQIIDESGLEKKTYTNFKGQTILERVGNATDWHDTYYVYDLAGKVRYIFPPEASNRFTEYRDGAKDVFLSNWCFQYIYDNRGRLIEKKVPGADWVYYIFDKWDRIVLSQDGNQRANSEWSYTKYDALNRPVLTGLITGSRSTVTTNVNNATVRYETRANNAIGYTNDAYPSHSNANLLTIHYYDCYNFIGYTGWDEEGNSFTASSDGGLIDLTKIFKSSNSSLVYDPVVKGYATGSKVKNLANDTWLNSVIYYDKKYRVVQTIGENHLGDKDIASTSYDFSGKKITEKITHKSDYEEAVTFKQDYAYDHRGRLLTVIHTIGNQAPVVMVSNKYNELGQLIEKNVHSTDNGQSFLQSVDQYYNINGMLAGINNSSLTNDGVKNDDSNDLFGMEILYNETEPISNGSGGTFNPTKLYDGNIAAIKWSSRVNSTTENIYGFEYDVFKRFKGAYFATKSSGSWSGSAGNFNESVSSYDKNGNIGTSSTATALIRNGLSNSAKTAIDQLKYEYQGNQLISLGDDASNSRGFDDKTNASGVIEFRYDNNGNLIADDNKLITSITYNHLNFPTEITKDVYSGGQFVRTDQLKFAYDASGTRLSREVWLGGTLKWKTHYVGNLQYDQDIDASSDPSISFIGTIEGRAVRSGSTYNYEYFYRDHQNNVRLVYGAGKETRNYRATMEVNYADKETNASLDGFKNINERRASPAFNITKSDQVVLAPNASALCNAHSSVNKAIGPAKSFTVSSGDVVYMETFANYKIANTGTGTVAAALLAGYVTSVFQITAGENPILYQNMNSSAFLPGGSVATSSTIPKAYMAYLFFDANGVYKYSGAVSIDEHAFGDSYQKLAKSFTADQDGTIYIFLANESNVNVSVNVYFDEFSIIHQKNNLAAQVLQASDYYPFGLSFNEYNIDQLRLKENSATEYEPTLRNRHLFQDQEWQKDLDINWYGYKYRMHDPAIGRFGAVDPLAEKYQYNSVYAFQENRLIEGIELEGLELLTLNGGFTARSAQFSISLANGAWNMAVGGFNVVRDGGTMFGHGLTYFGMTRFGGYMAEDVPAFSYSWGESKWGSGSMYTHGRADIAEPGGNTIATMAAAETGGLFLRAGAPYALRFITPQLEKFAFTRQLFKLGAPEIVAESSTSLVTKYPANGVIAGTSERTFLMPGQVIDRYGELSGKWFSTPGTSYGARSIPPGLSPYTQFRVLKPFEVQKSLASTGMFSGQTGFGIQFQSPIGADILIKRGIIAPF